MKAAITPGAWHSFVDAWAQLHNVDMNENARASLCNALGNISQEELARIQAQPVVTRITDARGITYRPDPELQAIAKPSAAPRIVRRPAPAALPPDRDPNMPRARVVRRPGPVR